MKNRFTLKDPSMFADIEMEKQKTELKNPEVNPEASEQPKKIKKIKENLDPEQKLIKKQKILSLIKKYREKHNK